MHTMFFAESLTGFKPFWSELEYTAINVAAEKALPDYERFYPSYPPAYDYYRKRPQSSR